MLQLALFLFRTTEDFKLVEGMQTEDFVMQRLIMSALCIITIHLVEARRSTLYRMTIPYGQLEAED